MYTEILNADAVGLLALILKKYIFLRLKLSLIKNILL